MSTTLLVCLPVFMLRHLHERLLQLILSIPCIPDKKLSYLKKNKANWIRATYLYSFKASFLLFWWLYAVKKKRPFVKLVWFWFVVDFYGSEREALFSCILSSFSLSLHDSLFLRSLPPDRPLVSSNMINLKFVQLKTRQSFTIQYKRFFLCVLVF